ncbi:hypothetical protein SAMN05518801_12416 [Novosphingobium sp. CF614]|uniref:hypothetical protein n=1 Tax=Novosphingobium sp. CF614 TaxID=1884364 RepID=UPI0008E1B800|nr:hypothetical protein [Novosphingobium sp. CF614]SFG41679.1 hypothetical protein SAMN05518801_12416 [Novosphingobium sp. CF614]
MAIAISKSVGRNGVNLPGDVKTVRQLLNTFLKNTGKPALAANASVDDAMLAAIEAFQSQVMKFPHPDGRIDPGGKTITALVAQSETQTGPAAAPTASAGTPSASGAISVTYGNVDKKLQLVSPYSIAVVVKALAMAKMNAAVITSTLRLPADQARIMYGNAKSNLANQFNLYGPTGDEVLKVFKDNRDKPESQVIDLMRLKIEEQLGKGRQVSRHVATIAGYGRLNVFDIGLNSTRKAAGSTFSLEKLTNAFVQLKKDGYIQTFIDETAKSNTCWHLEIVPNSKPL